MLRTEAGVLEYRNESGGMHKKGYISEISV